MKKIGVLPSVRLFTDNDIYNDRYTFVNNYVLRAAETGALPMGILGCDGYVDRKVLDECDAFIIPGGMRIAPMHFQTVAYAVESGKKLLGICMGAQAISSYFAVRDEAEARDFKGDLLELYNTMKKERYMFVTPVEHHWDVHMIRDEEDKSKHEVFLEKGTMLHELAGCDSIMGATMHNYQINRPSGKLIISGRAADGCIECIENSDNIIGVQFHPEVDRKNFYLFDFLVK